MNDKKIEQIEKKIDALADRLESVERGIKLLLAGSLMVELGRELHPAPALSVQTAEETTVAEAVPAGSIEEERALLLACRMIGIEPSAAEDTRVEGGYGGRYDVAFTHFGVRKFFKVNARIGQVRMLDEPGAVAVTLASPEGSLI